MPYLWIPLSYTRLPRFHLQEPHHIVLLFYFVAAVSCTYSTNLTHVHGQLHLNIMLSGSRAKDVNTMYHNSCLFNTHYMLSFIHKKHLMGQ